MAVFLNDIQLNNKKLWLNNKTVKRIFCNNQLVWTAEAPANWESVLSASYVAIQPGSPDTSKTSPYNYSMSFETTKSLIGKRVRISGTIMKSTFTYGLKFTELEKFTDVAFTNNQLSINLSGEAAQYLGNPLIITLSPSITGGTFTTKHAYKSGTGIEMNTWFVQINKLECC